MPLALKWRQLRDCSTSQVIEVRPLPKFRKSSEELELELREQLDALRSSAAGYDSGQLWQAKTLASVMYILVHDGTGRTKSLLGQLGILAKARMLSSLVIPPSVSGGAVISAWASPLLFVRVRLDGATYEPVLGDGPFREQYRWLPFSRWYEQRIFHPVSQFTLTRKNMIFMMRSQDGGAHVDGHRSDEQYDSYTRYGDPLIRVSRSGTGVELGQQEDGTPIPNAARALMRQLAWELDQSLQALGY